MKLNRLILACTLLLLVSVPAFALPQCGECTEFNECVYSPWSGLPCRYNTQGMCEEYFRNCTSLAPEATVASEWTVASVEISRPAVSPDLVTTAADAAITDDADTARAGLQD